MFVAPGASAHLNEKQAKTTIVVGIYGINFQGFMA